MNSLRLIAVGSLLAFVLHLPLLAGAGEPPPFEDAADFPLMGDWTGRWIKPMGWPQESYPQVAAHVLPMEPGVYRVVIFNDLYRRAFPLAEFSITSDSTSIAIDEQGWQAEFRPDESVRGFQQRGNHRAKFELTKAQWAPPTLGAKPPDGAKILFDGTSLDHWEHEDGRPATWIITNHVMETVGASWNNGQNRKDGLGGDLMCKHRFGSLHYHMEFRYPVEQGKRGQDRGNSGLFFPPLPELQILNSYTTIGYYDEAGSLYRHLPATVNAAGPPLVWQTYDVTIELTGNGTAILTADLNGHRIHNRVELKTDATELGLRLQDHNNRLQWRNIWVKE